MTLADSHTRKVPGRVAVLALLVIAMVVFAMVPSTLQLEPSAVQDWYVAGWLIAPLAAGLAALRAAAKSQGTARKAWYSFALGGFAWMAATVTWASYGWVGAVLPFPSLADAFYIGTSVFFIIGIFHYSLAGSGGGRLQVTNFALAISSVLAVGLVIYLPMLLQSKVGWFGAFVAFLYPALWLGTCAFGLICYSLYVPVRRSFPLLLILGATGAQATGDFFYGLDVLSGAYTAGAFYDTSWIAGFALMTWAALEHRPAMGIPLRPAMPTAPHDRPGESFVPAVSLAAVLSAGAIAEWHHLGLFVLLFVPLIVSFAVLIVIREQALFTAERTLRTQAEESATRLARSEARLSSVLENTTDGVMVLDTEWRVTFANQKAVAMLFKDRDYLGRRLTDLRRPDQTREFLKKYMRAMERQVPVEFEAHFPPMDLWLEVHAFPTAESLTVFFRDATERRRMREDLVRLAQHDPLTSLANRNLFGERLSRGLQGDRQHSDLILVLLDLDGFKAVNDSMGHPAGDALLRQFADRLNSVVRNGDTVARFGGDEFAIIQPGPAGLDGASEVARRISQALLEPFDVQGTQVTLAASIGIAVAPIHGTRPDELIFNADLALYRAKDSRGGGVSYCVFEPGVDDHLHSRQPLRPAPQRATAKA